MAVESRPLVMDTITESPFCSADADVLFPKITIEGGDNYIRGDGCLMTMLRTVIYPALDDDDFIRVKFKDLKYPCKKPTKDRVISELGIQNENDTDHTFTLINLDSYGEAYDPDTDEHLPIYNENWFRLLTNSVLQYKQEAGWEEVVRIRELSPSFSSVCYTNSELRSTIVVMEEMCPSFFHAICLYTPAYFPWYSKEKFDEVSPWKEMGRTLLQDNLDQFYAKVNELASKYDFEVARINRLLDGFESRITQNEIDAVKARLSQNLDEFNSYQSRITDILKKRDDYNIRLHGLEYKLEHGGESSEIKDYFLNSKVVSLEKTEGSTLTFVAKAHLDYFDESLAKRMLSNRSGCIFPSTGSGYSYDDVMPFLKALLLERKYRIRMCAAYDLRIGDQVIGRSHYRFSKAYDTYLPNSHIQENACLGNYRTTLNEMLLDGNYIGCIEQCIASAHSMAFNDVSANSFFRSFYADTSRHIIETKDGEIISVKEAIEREKKEGK